MNKNLPDIMKLYNVYKEQYPDATEEDFKSAAQQVGYSQESIDSLYSQSTTQPVDSTMTNQPQGQGVAVVGGNIQPITTPKPTTRLLDTNSDMYQAIMSDLENGYNESQVMKSLTSVYGEQEGKKILDGFKLQRMINNKMGDSYLSAKSIQKLFPDIDDNEAKEIAKIYNEKEGKSFLDSTLDAGADILRSAQQQWYGGIKLLEDIGWKNDSPATEEAIQRLKKIERQKKARTGRSIDAGDIISPLDLVPGVAIAKWGVKLSALMTSALLGALSGYTAARGEGESAGSSRVSALISGSIPLGVALAKGVGGVFKLGKEAVDEMILVESQVAKDILMGNSAKTREDIKKEVEFLVNTGFSVLPIHLVDNNSVTAQGYRIAKSARLFNEEIGLSIINNKKTFVDSYKDTINQLYKGDISEGAFERTFLNNLKQYKNQLKSQYKELYESVATQGRNIPTVSNSADIYNRITAARDNINNTLSITNTNLVERINKLIDEHTDLLDRKITIADLDNLRKAIGEEAKFNISYPTQRHAIREAYRTAINDIMDSELELAKKSILKQGIRNEADEAILKGIETYSANQKLANTLYMEKMNLFERPSKDKKAEYVGNILYSANPTSQIDSLLNGAKLNIEKLQAVKNIYKKLGKEEEFYSLAKKKLSDALENSVTTTNNLNIDYGKFLKLTENLFESEKQLEVFGIDKKTLTELKYFRNFAEKLQFVESLTKGTSGFGTNDINNIKNNMLDFARKLLLKFKTTDSKQVLEITKNLNKLTPEINDQLRVFEKEALKWYPYSSGAYLLGEGTARYGVEKLKERQREN